MSNPTITPHKTETHTWQVRKGLKLIFSGRMCEPEVILNETNTHSGVTLGLGELVQLAGLCGHPEFEQYRNPKTARLLQGIKHTIPYSGAEAIARKHVYPVDAKYQVYENLDYPGYTKVEILDGVQIDVRNKWGHNRPDRVKLSPEDVFAIIRFIVDNVASSSYTPDSEREYLPILGVPLSLR